MHRCEPVLTDIAARLLERTIHGMAPQRKKSFCDTSLNVVRVLFVDDHAPTRKELLELINIQADLSVVAEAETGEDGVEMAEEFDPDVILMDIALPGISGTEATRRILQHNPRARVLALSNHFGRVVLRTVIDSGAKGYVRKERAFEELIPAIRAISSGQPYWSHSPFE